MLFFFFFARWCEVLSLLILLRCSAPHTDTRCCRPEERAQCSLAQGRRTMSTRLIGRRREGGCVHAAWPVSVPRARAQLPWLVEQKSGQRGSSALHLELLVRGSCGPHNRLGKASTLGAVLATH